VSRAARGRRAGRIVWAAVAVVLAVAWWGVPVDAGRVGALVGPDAPVRLSARAARLALRPLPTIVASGVSVTVKGRAEATLGTVAIGLDSGSLGADSGWRSARVRSGRVSIDRLAGVGPLGCEDVAGRVTPVTPTRVRLDLWGACRASGASFDEIRYRGHIDWDGGPVRSRGRLAATEPQVGAVRGEAVAARVRTAGDGVRVDAIRFDVGDGALVGRARWLRQGARRRVAFSFEGSGGDAARVLASGMHVAGRWVVRGRGRAIATTQSLARGLTGRGRVVVLDGAIEPLDLGKALLDGLAIWRGKARRRRLRRRFPDVFGGERLHFDRLVAIVHAKTGRWDVAPVRMQSASYHAAAHGRVGRDGSVHGRIDVMPTEPLADALLGRGALRAIVAGGHEQLVLPIEVGGRPGDLRVRPAPAFAREVLERALGGSALGDALERLLR